MDRQIAARFYRVSHPAADQPDFPDILLEASQLPHRRRETNVGSGVTLRIEHCHEMGRFLTGQFCRKQTENIPDLAGDDGLSANVLPDGHGLGHVAAFVYHRPTRGLLLQTNRQSATTNRISAYVLERSGTIFELDAVLRTDAFERLRGKALRKIHVRFASPDNLEVLERDGVAAARAAREVAEAYGATVIELTIQAEAAHSSHLNRHASPNLLRRLLNGEANVERLDVKAIGDDGIEPIDLIQQQMRVADEIDLPQGDPEAHYQDRRSWLVRKFTESLPEIEAMFAANRA